MSKLEVSRVCVDRSHLPVVRDVDLTVESGTISVLLGANGAGKTTLLKAIAGLMQPRSGEILFEGQAITASPAHRRVQYGIALSPEGRQVFPDQSIRDNLELGAYARRLTDYYASV